MIPGVIYNKLVNDVCELREFIQELLDYNESLCQLIDDDSYYVVKSEELFNQTSYCVGKK